MTGEQWHRLFKVCAVTMLVSFSILSIYYMWTHGIIKLSCVVNKLTGLYCSGCGITRAFSSLLKLDVYQAFRYNIYVVGTIPLIVFIYFKGTYEYIRYGMVTKNTSKLLAIYAVAFALFGLLRNIIQFMGPTIVN